MKFILSELLMMVIFGLICWFGLNMFNMFGLEQAKPDQTFVEKASGIIRDGYTSTVTFVSKANKQIKSARSIKDLIKELRSMMESISNKNQGAVDDLKSITPESLNLPAHQ